jgi:hypothetical protein
MDEAHVILNKPIFSIEHTSQRFPKNPFMDFIEINRIDKMIFAKTDSQAINTRTGEIMGQQVIAKFKKVDAGQFVKIFTDKLSHILELTKAGHKVLNIAMLIIQKDAMNSDYFFMSFKDAEIHAVTINLKISKITFERGVKDLIKNGIFARHYNQNMYFINPAIIYNGDRTKITFVEQYQVVSDEEYAQLELLP